MRSLHKRIFCIFDTMTDSEKFEEVCVKLEQGVALRVIFDSPNAIMSNTLFYKLIKENKEFNERYARAKEIFADKMFEEIIEIADEANADIVIGEGGQVHINGEAVQRSKLKVDARKWVLSKLIPKKYGERLDITTDGDKITQPFDYSKLSDAALAEIAGLKPEQGEG